MLIHKILFPLSGRWPTGASSICFGLAFRTFLDHRDVWEMVFVGLAILFLSIWAVKNYEEVSPVSTLKTHQSLRPVKLGEPYPIRV